MANGDSCVACRAVVAVAALVAVSGCAARASELRLAVRQAGRADGHLRRPDAPPPRAATLSEYMRKLRALQSKAAPKNSLLPTLESSDPALATALLLLAMHESAENHRLVAAAYRNAGVLDFAYRHFQRAVALEPCDAASYDGMARIWRDWGMPDLALGDAHRALYCARSRRRCYNTLGHGARGARPARRAPSAPIERAVALDPRAAFALNNLCYLALHRGRLARPPRVLRARRSRSIPTSRPRATTWRSSMRKRGRSRRRARQRLRDRRSPAAALYNIGILRLADGRYRRGRARVRSGRRGATLVDHRAPARPCRRGRPRERRSSTMMITAERRPRRSDLPRADDAGGSRALAST